MKTKATTESPNVFTTAQIKFLKHVKDTAFFYKISADTLEEYKRVINGVETWKKYYRINFQAFISSILKQGRYGNNLDTDKLLFIRGLYIWAHKENKL